MAEETKLSASADSSDIDKGSLQTTPVETHGELRVSAKSHPKGMINTKRSANAADLELEKDLGRGVPAPTEERPRDENELELLKLVRIATDELEELKSSESVDESVIQAATRKMKQAELLLGEVLSDTQKIKESREETLITPPPPQEGVARRADLKSSEPKPSTESSTTTTDDVIACLEEQEEEISRQVCVAEDEVAFLRNQVGVDPSVMQAAIRKEKELNLMYANAASRTMQARREREATAEDPTTLESKHFSSLLSHSANLEARRANLVSSSDGVEETKTEEPHFPSIDPVVLCETEEDILRGMLEDCKQKMIHLQIVGHAFDVVAFEREQLLEQALRTWLKEAEERTTRVTENTSGTVGGGGSQLDPVNRSEIEKSLLKRLINDWHQVMKRLDIIGRLSDVESFERAQQLQQTLSELLTNVDERGPRTRPGVEFHATRAALPLIKDAKHLLSEMIYECEQKMFRLQVVGHPMDVVSFERAKLLEQTLKKWLQEVETTPVGGSYMVDQLVLCETEEDVLKLLMEDCQQTMNRLQIVGHAMDVEAFERAQLLKDGLNERLIEVEQSNRRLPFGQVPSPALPPVVPSPRQLQMSLALCEAEEETLRRMIEEIQQQEMSQSEPEGHDVNLPAVEQGKQLKETLLERLKLAEERTQHALDQVARSNVDSEEEEGEGGSTTDTRKVVVFEIKPINADIDVERLGNAVIQLQREGIDKWVGNPRILPFGFGGEKLRVAATITMDVDEVCDFVSLEFPGDIQSVEVLSVTRYRPSFLLS